MPSVERLGSLPPDLAFTERPGAGPSCGSGACAASFDVRGRPGETAEQVADRMRRDLAGQGWRLDAEGQGCRPVGWLTDCRSMCVWVGALGGGAWLSLEGARGYA